MGNLIEQFSAIALLYPDIDIHHLFNRFAAALKEKELQFLFDNFEIFIESAEAARQAPEEIKKWIVNPKKQN